MVVVAFFMVVVARPPLTFVRRAIGWLASPKRRIELRRAGRPRGCRGQASYRPQVNDKREVFLDVLEKLVIHGDELAPLPFCQGDVEAVMQAAPDR